MGGRSGAGGSCSCIGGPSSAPGPAIGPGAWPCGATGWTRGRGRAAARARGGRGGAGRRRLRARRNEEARVLLRMGRATARARRPDARRAGRIRREMCKLEPRSEAKPEKLRLVVFLLHHGLGDVDIDEAERRLPRDADAGANPRRRDCCRPTAVPGITGHLRKRADIDKGPARDAEVGRDRQREAQFGRSRCR